jgi:hypothetical protein
MPFTGAVGTRPTVRSSARRSTGTRNTRKSAREKEQKLSVETKKTQKVIVKKSFDWKEEKVIAK